MVKGREPAGFVIVTFAFPDYQPIHNNTNPIPNPDHPLPKLIRVMINFMYKLEHKSVRSMIESIISYYGESRVKGLPHETELMKTYPYRQTMRASQWWYSWFTSIWIDKQPLNSTKPGSPYNRRLLDFIICMYLIHHPKLISFWPLIHSRHKLASTSIRVYLRLQFLE